MDRLTILGSGFAVANQEQENTYLIYQSEKHTVLVDCGNNPVGKMQRAGITVNQVTDLILTHAHADHMGALPLLLMDMWLLKRETALNIYGLPVTLEKARALLAIFDWEKWANMFKVNFFPVSDETIQKVIDTDDIRVSTGPVVHLIPTIGVRIESPAKGTVVVYSCDGEPSDKLDRLASGATMLIQEAAGPGKGHTSPEDAGKNASKAGAKELILIHYGPDFGDADLEAKAKKYFSGSVKAGKDLQYFE